ncbi:MAG: CinA family protein [Deltaproteobacteria bacterium]|nr:CinA family protein [Deltaproteobacteria bacterium]
MVYKGLKASAKKSIGHENRVAERLIHARLTVALAESCTGGLASCLMTDVPGSSAYFRGSVIAYSDDLKIKLLGVKPSTIGRFGAVSEKTAVEMASGVRKRLKADIGLSITGIAGPSGGRAKKPVGTVYVSVSIGRRRLSKKFLFKGNRASIKRQSAKAALKALHEAVSGMKG